MATTKPQTFAQNVAAYGEEPRRASEQELAEKKIGESTATEAEKSVSLQKSRGSYLGYEEAKQALATQGSQSPYWQSYKSMAVAKNPNMTNPLEVDEIRADSDLQRKKQTQEDSKLRSTYYNQGLSAGMMGKEAIDFAEKAMENERTKRSIQLQQGLLSADQERLNLENAKKDLNRQGRLTQFQMALNAHDPLNIAKSNESLHEIEKQFPDLLADASKEGAPIAKMAREAFKDKKKESDSHAETARNYVQRYGIDLTPDLLDKKTGYLDYNAADKRGMAMMQQKEQRMLEMKGKEAELTTQKAIDVYSAKKKQDEEAYQASPKAKYEAARTKVQNLSMANQLVKGIPLTLIDNEEEITTGKVKWYSASRDKSGKMVADPNGEFRVFENPKDKKSPYQIIPKTDLEQARVLKAGGEEQASNQGVALDQDTAMSILNEAGGDTQKARDLARQRGYTF